MTTRQLASPTRAHPRSRRENYKSGSSRHRHTGSSPLTRGKLDLVPRWGLPRGRIPTHAGKTHPATMPAPAAPAHPRSRGENTIRALGNGHLQGSSPLTRGKPPILLGENCRHGLIPTHAGKTATRPPPPSNPTAHPRSRGENPSATIDPNSLTGSSPLTRGKLEARRTPVRDLGLIPTHAGKTGPTPMRAKPSRAHPRSRGENYPISPAAQARTGSSPLTRGKPA